MRTTIYFLLSGIISAFAGFGALGSKNIVTTLICLAISIIVWILFFWGWKKRVRQESSRRLREEMFANHMRTHMRNSDLR